MQSDTPLIVKLIGQRPPSVPDDWLIFNAARPISGNLVWEGEFFLGNHYAAIRPENPGADQMIRLNVEAHAVQLQYLLPEAAITEQMAYYEEHMPMMAAMIDLNNDELRTKMLEGWRNRQRVEYPPRGGEAL